MLGSVIKAKKKYYPQTLLEECKYEQERSESDESDSDSNDDECNE